MIEQIGIALTGAVAVFLSQTKAESTRKYACLFGLAGQPFWFYTTFINAQWGIFILSFIYAWSWYRGFKIYWQAGVISTLKTITNRKVK